MHTPTGRVWLCGSLYRERYNGLLLPVTALRFDSTSSQHVVRRTVPRYYRTPYTTLPLRVYRFAYHHVWFCRYTLDGCTLTFYALFCDCCRGYHAPQFTAPLVPHIVTFLPVVGFTFGCSPLTVLDYFGSTLLVTVLLTFGSRFTCHLPHLPCRFPYHIARFWTLLPHDTLPFTCPHPLPHPFTYYPTPTTPALPPQPHHTFACYRGLLPPLPPPFALLHVTDSRTLLIPTAVGPQPDDSHVLPDSGCLTVTDVLTTRCYLPTFTDYPGPLLTFTG